MCDFSFCESVLAGPKSKWHIRKLTESGKKLGGGIDTESLCGYVTTGWDLEVEIREFHLKTNTCTECLKKYRELLEEAGDKEVGES